MTCILLLNAEPSDLIAKWKSFAAFDTSFIHNLLAPANRLMTLRERKRDRQNQTQHTYIHIERERERDTGAGQVMNKTCHSSIVCFYIIGQDKNN